jgi:hypothetical protein
LILGDFCRPFLPDISRIEIEPDRGVDCGSGWDAVKNIFQESVIINKKHLEVYSGNNI